MLAVKFRYHGKVGHFLRAEANVAGLTYPIPTPTALLGLAGAVLGLEKDEPQAALEGAQFAVAGRQPLRFWHTTNVRKDPPAPLPDIVKRTYKGKSPPDQRNMRFAQEWLWRPDYHVWAALPEKYHAEFVARVKEGRGHFMPCLGLANMLAHLEFVEESEAEELGEAVHLVETVAPTGAGELDMKAAFEMKVTLQSLRMPCHVDADRSFGLRTYWVERDGKAYPLRTRQAVRCGSAVVVWL